MVIICVTYSVHFFICQQSASKINGPMMEKVSKQMEEHEGSLCS